jgi:hypothetical protein
MRRLLCVWTLVVTLTSVLAGQRVTKPEELDRAMKTIGTSFGAGSKAIASATYADAKPALLLARQTLASTRPFWMDRGIDEANRLAREAIARLDALDDALSAATVDAAVVADRLKAVGGACGACHQTYREGDAQSGYRIKAGLP